MKTTLDARGVQPVAPFRPWFLTLFILVVGCGGADGGSLADEEPTTPDRADLRFVVVTHSVAANPFWSVVTNGVADAAEELGVQVDYQAVVTFDMVAMSQLIDAAPWLHSLTASWCPSPTKTLLARPSVRRWPRASP